MTPSKDPRLVDVARHAGVSTATVSRVLNDRGYLSEETKSRVQQAIAELGYRPNQVARSLLSQRTGTVGLIVPSVAQPFFGEMAVGVENALADRGLRMLLCDSYGRADRELEHLELLVANRVDGIISGAHNDPLSLYDSLRQPVVTIDRELASHIPNVRAENERGAVMATEELLRSGSKRPALLTSRSHDRNLRERGYRSALAAVGIEPLILTADFNIPEPDRTTRVWQVLDAAGQIDGIFATDDLLAARALEWAHVSRRAVPQDLRVVGFDGTPTMRLALPGLTTIVQPIAEICATAVTLLIEQMELDPDEAAERAPVPAVELPVTLARGRTTSGDIR